MNAPARSGGIRHLQSNLESRQWLQQGLVIASDTAGRL